MTLKVREGDIITLDNTLVTVTYIGNTVIQVIDQSGMRITIKKSKYLKKK